MDYQVCKNYHQDCEHGVSKQINISLNSFYVYMVMKPAQDEWSNDLAAMQGALQMEKDVTQCLLDLHKLATHHVDPQLCDFLCNHYLDEQAKMIKKLGDHITDLHRLGAPDNGL